MIHSTNCTNTINPANQPQDAVALRTRMQAQVRPNEETQRLWLKY
jgi:hypothetical protein